MATKPKSFPGCRPWIFITIIVLVAACGRPPDVIGIDNEDKPVASAVGVSTHKIFVATTRKKSVLNGQFFSGERGDGLALASVIVSIPPGHQRGELERPTSLPPDPERHFAVVNPTIYTSERAFVGSMNKSLESLVPQNRNVLFFVHGYNSSLSDATLRLAQFVEDSGYDGIPVLLSWASAAEPLKYVYDINSALAARQDLLRATSIATRSRANQFDLLAHSMGAFLTMEAISQAELQGEFNNSKRLRNIILAAPDIDLKVFEEQLGTITHDNQEFFVLVSSDDKALGFSRAVSGGVERVGAADAEKLANLGVTVIDLSEINNSNSGSHSKFFGSSEVVQLLGQGIKTSSRFGRRTNAEFSEIVAGVPIQIVSD